MGGSLLPLSILSLFYILHFAQEAILILWFEFTKEQYIREAVSVQRDLKLCLPKVMVCYAKDSGLSPANVVVMVQHHLPVGLRRARQKRQKEKPRRSVEWLPHNHLFRYLLSRELVK